MEKMKSMKNMSRQKSDRLKVVMLGHKRIPSREGGIEVVVEELSTRMAALGCDVTCFNRRGDHISGKEFSTEPLKEYKGVKLKTVFTINKRGIAAMTSSIAGAIQAAFGNYDVVHFHAEGPCVLLWLPKLMGKRCIVTVHGLDHRSPKWGKLASRYIRLGEQTAVRWANEIIVLSKGIHDYFMKEYGRKTVLIPNGVELPAAAADRRADLIKEKYGLDKDGYVLFLGRIVPGKGLECLIHAYKKLDTEKKLVIAGGASDSEEYMMQIREMASSDPRIFFTGFVQGQELEELYSNAYIYTLPSLLEGMPLSLLEAMSYGNCCLVSDIPECADVVEDKAVICKVNDEEDLREKLQMLMQDEALVQQYKSNASDYICRKYSWDDVARQTLKLYNNEEV